MTGLVWSSASAERQHGEAQEIIERVTQSPYVPDNLRDETILLMREIQAMLREKYARPALLT